MGHTYSSHFTHLVWATKNRLPLIDQSFRSELYKYIKGIAQNKHITMLKIGGIGDHIHTLVALPTTKSTSYLVREIKSNSSRFIRSMYNPDFAWQEGYADFSVSRSLIEKARLYIQNQEQHHKKQTFEAELSGLLKKHGIDYDTKSLFE